MTLKQAIKSRLTLEPGGRINTPAGWVRADRVFLGGTEIGCVQTRRARRGTEIMTVARLGMVKGYDIDWLVQQVMQGGHNRSAA